MNQVVLAGFLGKDPQIVKRENFSIARLSIATKMYRNKEQATDWHEVEAFGANADYIEKNLRKGDFIVVSGYLTTTAYTDKSGQERKNYNVKCTSVEGNNQGRTQPQQQSAPAPKPQQQSYHNDDDIPY